MSAKRVSLNLGHTILISEDGRVFTFGYNPDGQCGTGLFCNFGAGLAFILISIPNMVLGTGEIGTVIFPTEISPDCFGGAKIVSAAAGRLNSLFLDYDGRVYSCGNASKGRLGNGARRNVLSPEQVHAEGVLAVAAGMDHCMLLVR